MLDLFENKIGYAKDTNALGGIAGVDFLNGTVSLVTETGDIVASSLEELVLLEEVGAIDGEVVYNHDVLRIKEAGSEFTYEIELLEDNKIVFHLLDSKLERVETGEPTEKDNFKNMAFLFEIVDSIYVLKTQLPTIDFNIKIVRESSEGGKLFYACNNEIAEEIDLIKVVFMGHQLFEQEKYERVTLSYDGYLDSVERGLLEEITPQELFAHAVGLVYGDTEEEEEVVEDENFHSLLEQGIPAEELCETCHNLTSKCDCLWKY